MAGNVGAKHAILPPKNICSYIIEYSNFRAPSPPNSATATYSHTKKGGTPYALKIPCNGKKHPSPSVPFWRRGAPFLSYLTSLATSLAGNILWVFVLRLILTTNPCGRVLTGRWANIVRRQIGFGPVPKIVTPPDTVLSFPLTVSPKMSPHKRGPSGAPKMSAGCRGG